MKTTLSLLAASCLVVPVSADELQPGTELVDLFKMSQLEGVTEEDLRRMLEENAASEIQLPELKEFRGEPRDAAPHPQAWHDTPMPIQPDPLRLGPPEQGPFQGGEAFRGPDGELKPEGRRAFQDIEKTSRQGASPWAIGVLVEPLHPMTRNHFELSDGTGVRVADIVPGSPAAGTELKVNDIIVAANGRKVSSLDDLKNVVKIAGRERNAVKLEVIHRGSRKVVKVMPRGPEPLVGPSKEERPVPADPKHPMMEIQRRLDAQQKEIETLRREVRELRERLDQE